MYATSYRLGYQVAVKDQGPFGTCYPNALTSSIESMLLQAGMPVSPLSRMQNYYDTREAQGTLPHDTGSIGYMSLYAATTKGIAPESLWGYSEYNLNWQPAQYVYDFAQNTRVAHYSSVYNHSAEAVRDSVLEYLSQGKSVVAGFYLRDYFYGQSGSLAQLNGDGSGPTRGGHAVQIVGYNANLDGGSYIVKNSWGTGWGDNGYGVINYQQMSQDFISMEVVTGFRLNNTYVDFSFTPIKERVAELYVTLLGRAPELTGMNWWIENSLSAVATRGVFADLVINSAEGQALYGNKNNAQFVDVAYHNILGRGVDESGLAFWSGALENGYTRGDVFDMIIESVKMPGGESSELLENKINLAMYITVALQYDGSEDVAVKMEIAAVTADDNALEIIKIGIPTDWEML